MTLLTVELQKTTMELKELGFNLPQFEALQIAVQIQRNRIFEEAFVVGEGVPSAFEKIAMELGASIDGNNIKNALYKLSEP